MNPQSITGPQAALRLGGLLGFVITFTLSVAAESAAATEVYRWVGDDGTVHFSDTPPPDDTVPVHTLELSETTPDYDPAADPYSILNQARRIHETWMEIEGLRQQRAPAATVNAPAPRSSGRYSTYGYASSVIYPSVPPNRPTPFPTGIARQQAHALNELDLVGERPYSINSGAHRERVERSQALPLVPPAPVPRPGRLPAGGVR
jgi:hypothetical protein